MIKYLLLTIIFQLSLTCYSQFNDEKERLIRQKNKISEIHSYGYNLKSGDSLLFQKKHYDSFGKKVLFTRYKSNGNLNYRMSFYYNANNQYIKSLSVNENGDTTSSTNWEWREDGSRTKINFNTDSIVHYGSTYLYTYDYQDSGKYVRKSNGEYYLQQENFFNKNRKNYRSLRYKENGLLDEEKIAEFDDKGYRIAWYKIENEERIKYIEYENDSIGQITVLRYTNKGRFYIPGTYNSSIKKDSDITIIERRFKYDNNGNRIEEKRLENGKVVDLVRFYFVKKNT